MKARTSVCLYLYRFTTCVIYEHFYYYHCLLLLFYSVCVYVSEEIYSLMWHTCENNKNFLLHTLTKGETIDLLNSIKIFLLLFFLNVYFVEKKIKEKTNKNEQIMLLYNIKGTKKKQQIINKN